MVLSGSACSVTGYLPPAGEQADAWSDDGADGGAPTTETAAQAAARAAFAEEKGGDAFYSSDDESEGHSSATGSLVSGSAASLTEPNKRFKVIIKVSSGRQNS